MTFSQAEMITMVGGKILNDRRSTYGDYEKVPDIDWSIVEKEYSKYSKPVEDVVTEETKTEETIPETTPTSTNDGSGSSTTETEEPVNVHDLNDDTGTPGNVDDVLAPNKDWEEELKNVNQEIEDLKNAKQPQYQGDAGYQKESDIFGTLMDTGRGIMGYIGANKEVPTYSRGSMFNSAMGRADARKDQGLSAVELAARERAGEEAYGYDIKNIARASGGNAGAYLANAGSAVNRLYGQKADTAAQDEAVRRLNNQNFQGMALQDEQINRQIFNDELNQTMMTKQAGSGLLNDSIKNIQERIDYNRQFGNDSIYSKYMNTKIRDTESSIYDRDLANQKRLEDMMKEKIATRESILKNQNASAPTIKGTANANSSNTIIPKQSIVKTQVAPIADSATLNDKTDLNIDEAKLLFNEREQAKIDKEEADFLEMEANSKRKSLFRKKK